MDVDEVALADKFALLSPHLDERQRRLDRNELTDLLAAAEDEGGYGYVLICLLGLNGLRVSEACSAVPT